MSSQAQEPRKTGKSRHKGRGKTNARRAAAALLGAIMRGKTLDEARDKLTDLNDSERNLADAIGQAALRHYGEIDDLLKSLSKKCRRATLWRSRFYSSARHSFSI